MNQPVSRVQQVKKQWGRWKWSQAELSIIYEGERGQKFQVPLSRCDSHVKLAEWIVNLAQKPWLQGQGLVHFVLALDELLQFRENRTEELLRARIQHIRLQGLI